MYNNKMVILKDEEIVVLNGYPKKKNNGSISIKALINIYTDEGVFSKVIKLNLTKSKFMEKMAQAINDYNK